MKDNIIDFRSQFEHAAFERLPDDVRARTLRRIELLKRTVAAVEAAVLAENRQTWRSGRLDWAEVATEELLSAAGQWFPETFPPDYRPPPGLWRTQRRDEWAAWLVRAA